MTRSTDSVSQAPTAEEVLALLAPGILNDIEALAAQSIIYGTYVILITVSLYALLGRRNLASTVLATALFSMFALSTFLWASKLAIFIQRFHIAFIRTEGSLLSRLTIADSDTEKMRYMDDIMFIVLYLIGDAVMVWRIMVLSQRSRWVLLLTVTLWVGTSATGFGLIGCLVHADFPSPEHLTELCFMLENVSWVISLALNGVSTLFLTWMAWSHRRSVSRYISSTGTTQIDYVLNILAISGVLYFLLGVPRLITFANGNLNPAPTEVAYITNIVESIMDAVVGLYPTAVSAVLFLRSNSITPDGRRDQSAGISGDVTREKTRPGLASDDTLSHILSTERDV